VSVVYCFHAEKKEKRGRRKERKRSQLRTWEVLIQNKIKCGALEGEEKHTQIKMNPGEERDCASQSCQIVKSGGGGRNVIYLTHLEAETLISWECVRPADDRNARQIEQIDVFLSLRWPEKRKTLRREGLEEAPRKQTRSQGQIHLRGFVIGESLIKGSPA